MSKFGLILAARTNSSRLPGKVLLPLLGLPIVGLIIERLKTSSLVDEIILATTDKLEDDPVASIASEMGVACFRGSEENVLERYYLAAKESNLDYIIRATADEPFINGEMLDYVIEHKSLLSEGYDLVTTKPYFPHGLDFEMIQFSLLQKMAENACAADEKEHMLNYVYNRKDMYHIFKLRSPHWLEAVEGEFLLDNQEDYDKFKECLKGKDDPLIAPHAVYGNYCL